MATTADFRNGMTLRVDGDILEIVEFLHVKPGKGGAFVRSKLKNVRTGAVTEKTYRAGEKVTEVRLERRSMEYIYKDGDSYVFMDKGTFEQILVPEDYLKDKLSFLKEGTLTTVLYAGEELVGVILPTFCDLVVTTTDPGLKGDTASGGSKPATLETGPVIAVPLFVNEGDVVRVDTRTKEYVERVGKQEKGK
ncbi:elongation factor P [candidate division TA06 bacterium]|uniref:Elongation factor P n=1 Tax=candidate division TA06 bacterium TaxID=2250710 RepID=A0A523UNT5_UNCT6|nr:MAG: elongation factor P [candidate division TA06 bacterium]